MDIVSTSTEIYRLATLGLAHLTPHGFVVVMLSLWTLIIIGAGIHMMSRS